MSLKHIVKRTLLIRSPRCEEQGKNWTDPRGKQLICTARSPGNEEKVREIKEAGWGEVRKFRVGKNFWTSTGVNLRKTRAFLSGWGIYCAVQKEKVCGHVTMEAKFLGEFAALFTNTRSLVPSRPRGFRMWRSLSKHVNSKVPKRTMEHGNTQNGSKSSLCTDPPPLRKNRRRGPFSDCSWGERGLYTG